MIRLLLASFVSLSVLDAVNAQDNAKPLKILFLGDDAGHKPQERFRLLQPALAKRNIDLTYTDKVTSLDPKILNSYAGLVIYANHLKISPEQEQALLDYVDSGHGFIPLHCASYCFLNSPKYIELVGAQFQKHGTGIVETTQAKVDHPILKDFKGFKSWDETYVHTKHNDKDRTILEFRDEKGKPEPWTWTRTHGKGRVFYTAWGHDARTWSNPGFHNLVERGIRWAVNDDTPVPPFTSEASGEKAKLKPFEYQEAKIPFYPPAGGKGGPLSKMQLPVDADESIKHMVVPKGMKVELFAADPQIYRPICMNWDAKGRLWIAETLDYPNEMNRTGEGRDRLVICEDTDGDGKADKFTVFADKLSIPTGFTFANGGVIVVQAPDTLFLKDSTGGDKADERKVLFTGWGTFDTHAGPSNLHYGFDNWIYGIVGYSGFGGTVGGEKHKFGQGFFRFKPDGSKLEFLRSTNNNSWGVGFSEDGMLFGSTANGNASVHMPIPNRYYEKVKGWSSSVLGTIADSQRIEPITDKIRQVDQHGKFTAAAGHALYTARTYPKEYWNKIAFVTEPTGHLVAKFEMEPKGGTFVAKNQGSFLASDDEWTAPIMAEVGPDGQMWVIDWYNYIVQHNPTPPGFKTGRGNAYETPLRDKSHGRVVRVVYPDGKASVNPKLDVNNPETLVAALKHDNLLWRKHAQRLLVERGKTDVVPALLKLVSDPTVDEIGVNVGATHAIWTLQGLGAIDKSDDAIKVLFEALKHKSPGVRRAAWMTLPRNDASVQALVEPLPINPEAGSPLRHSRFLDVVFDKEPQVKLAALLAISEMPTNEKLGKLMLMPTFAQGTSADPVVRDAASAAAAVHCQAMFAAMQATPIEESDEVPGKEILERAAEHLARTTPGDSVNGLVASLPSQPKVVRAAIVQGLVRGWPADQPPTLTEPAAKALAALLKSGDAAQAKQITALAKRWKVPALDGQFKALSAESLKQLRDEKQSDADRLAAAAALVEMRGNDPSVVKEITVLLTPRSSPEFAKGLLEAIGKSDISSAGNEIAALVPTLTPAIRPTAVRILMARPEWTRALLDGLDKGAISADNLSLDQKQSLLNHPTKSLAARAKTTLSKSGGLPNADREKVIVELTPLLKETGDPALGKAVFLKNCALCHRHGADGAKIGPDLTGMAVHPKSHLLVEIIDPNRSVEGNYRQYVVTTKKGTVITGLLASESKTAIEIVDSQAKTHAIQRDDIDELQATTKSLMPEGFEKQITTKDLVNLLEFLTQRGRFTPLPLAKVATTVSTKGMFLDEASPIERLVFPNWNVQTFAGVPFQLVDPQGTRVPNVVVLAGGPKESLCHDNPKSVSLPCNASAKAVHLLSGVAGWAHPGGKKGSTSMIVRLHYTDGSTEDHALKNGEHFADYIRRVDVPGSQFAFALRSQQMRYLSIQPKKADVIERIELVKGTDGTAPVVMAVTVESR